MASYALHLCSWPGAKFMEIPLGPGTYFEYIKAVNRTGQFILELPYQVHPSMLQLDNLVQFWRGPGDVPAYQLDFMGWLRYWRTERREDGSVVTIMKGHDPNGLLDRRIVAYDSDNSWTYANEDPDTIIRNVFGQNFTSIATDVYRDLAKVDGLPSPVGAHISMYTIGKSFSPTHAQIKYAYWPVHDLFQQLHEISFTNDPTATKDQTVYYGIRARAVENTGWQKPILVFEITFGQWGQDRTWDPSARRPIIFNNASGNLVNEFHEEDHRGEKNVIYAGGPGEGSSRIVSQCIDYSRTRQSGWARCEGWVDARQQETSAQVSSVGYAKLAEMRPRIIAGGDLLDTPNARYGVQWYHGDRVTIEVFGVRYEGVVMSTQLKLKDGEETITARVIHQNT